MQNERAHRQKSTPRRNASYLAQATAMRRNIAGGDAPEPMRPRNNAQWPIRLCACVDMNPYRDQLGQQGNRWLAVPRAFLFRPDFAGSIGGSFRNRDTQVLMQGD